MPTRQRIRSSILVLSERLDDLGYTVGNVLGPYNESGEKVPEDEVSGLEDEDLQYFLTARVSKSEFYIQFRTAYEYGIIVYSMDILGHLASYLDNEEVESIIEESISWADLEEEKELQLRSQAVESIISNTDPVQFHEAAFNLGVYASTSMVEYLQTTTENGFPKQFQTTRGIFPYTEKMSLKRVDDRIHPVIVAGERGRRYVEYSFRIDKDDKDPSEYEFRHII